MDVELTEGLLDGATLDALFEEITRSAELLDVFVKGGANHHASAGPADLRAARAALDAGARGVQVRYGWEGAEWRDTVMSAPGGYRVVRTKMPVRT